MPGELGAVCAGSFSKLSLESRMEECVRMWQLASLFRLPSSSPPSPFHGAGFGSCFPKASFLASSFSAQLLEKPADWAPRVGSRGDSQPQQENGLRFPPEGLTQHLSPAPCRKGCCWLLRFPHLGVKRLRGHPAWRARQPPWQPRPQQGSASRQTASHASRAGQPTASPSCAPPVFSRGDLPHP